MMHGHGKSDGPVVPAKPPNNGSDHRLDRRHPVPPPAEGAEGRGPAKGNPPEQPTLRTQGRDGVQRALARVRQAAKKDKKRRFTSLLHHIYNPSTLREAYFGLKRDAAPGVDGQTWQSYGRDLEANLRDLSARLKRGAYRAKPARRAYIPKPDGRQRPLGVTALEDKIVQRATTGVLNAIYETDFLGFSYGFRPGRNPHSALDALYAGLLTRKVNWVLDADIRGFLDTASYCTPIHARFSKRAGAASNTLIRKPLRFPQRTWTAFSSPRFTRCNTVCRETPSRRVASCITT